MRLSVRPDLHWTNVLFHAQPAFRQRTKELPQIMKTKLCAAIFFSAVSLSFGATIPAGTAIYAFTDDVISTHERIGSTFKAKLAVDVAAKGKVLLPAGTPLVGVVEGSLRPPMSKGAVIVNLKSISANGRNVPVQTTGAYKLPPRWKTKRGVSVSGRETNYPYQTRLAFQLAQPLNL